MLYGDENQAAGRPYSGLGWAVFSARGKARKRRRGFAWALNQILLLGLLVILIRLWGRYQEGQQELPQREIELEGDLLPERPAPGGMPAAASSGVSDAGARLQAEAEEVEVSDRPTAEEARQDDLKLIEGVGPKIEDLLRSSGINTFEELAGTGERRLAEILEQAGLRMANPSSWPEQARLAAAGDMEGLQQLKGHLKAGRRV